MPFLCGGEYIRSSTLREDDMDLLFVGVIILFFAASWWLLLSLDKL
jgi:hypothetical protein